MKNTFEGSSMHCTNACSDEESMGYNDKMTAATSGESLSITHASDNNIPQPHPVVKFGNDGSIMLPTAEEEWDAAPKRSEAETLLYLKKLDASVLADGGVSTTELSDLLKDKNTARSIFVEYSKSHFPSSVTNLETGHEIGISRNGIDKFLSGNISKEKYATGLKIPQLVESAHKVAEADNKKGKAGISGYEYYENKIKVDGNDYNVYIRVRNTDMGDRYYGHTIGKAVEDIKIEPSAWNSDGDTSVHSINALDSNNIIPQRTPGVKMANDGSIMLPTAEGEINAAAANKKDILPGFSDVTTETTEMTGRACGVSEENIGIAVRLSHALGVKVAFYRNMESAERGQYIPETGVIWVNSKYQDVFSNIFGHELTHRIEKSKFYKQLEKFVERQLRAEGKDINVLIKEKQESYGRRGVELTPEKDKADVIARYVGEVLLNSEVAIAEIAKMKNGLGSFILSKIDGLVAKITGKNKEAVYIRRVQQMFRKALEDVSRNEKLASSEGRTSSIYDDTHIAELTDRFRNGEISEAQYLEAYNEYIDNHPELEDEGEFDRSFDLDESKTNHILDSFGINEISNYIHVQRRVIETLEREGFFTDTESITRTAINKKSGLVVEIRPKGIKELFNEDNYTKTSKLLKTAKLAIIRYLPQMIETGKVINDQVKNLHQKNKTDVKYAYIEKNILLNSHPTTVTIAIRRTPQKNLFWVYKIDIKNNVVSQPGRIGDTNSITTGHSAYDIDVSIPEDLLPVKTLSKKSNDGPAKSKKNTKKINRQYDIDDFADDGMLYDSAFASEMDEAEKLKKDSAKFERYNRWRNDKDAYDSRGLAGASWWNKNRNKADRLFNKRELERLSKISSELEDADELTVEQVTKLWGEMRRLQRNVTAISMAYQITNEELTQVTDLLRGDRTIEDVENLPADRYNIDGIIAVANKKRTPVGIRFTLLHILKSFF